MKFYILRNENEPEITGNVFPQISEHKGWCWENYEFLSSLVPDKLPNKEFQLDYLKLHPKAKLTDFLSDGILFMGFIIEKKVKNIFEGMRLPDHKFFKTQIEFKGERLNSYYWFFPVNQTSHNIDFSNSFFFVSNRFVESAIVQSDIKFNSAAEIKHYEQKNPLHRIRPKNIKLLNDVDLDIFQFGVFSFDWIVTEALKGKLEENNISGCSLRKIPWFT